MLPAGGAGGKNFSARISALATSLSVAVSSSPRRSAGMRESICALPATRLLHADILQRPRPARSWSFARSSTRRRQFALELRRISRFNWLDSCLYSSRSSCSSVAVYLRGARPLWETNLAALFRMVSTQGNIGGASLVARGVALPMGTSHAAILLVAVLSPALRDQVYVVRSVSVSHAYLPAVRHPP